MEAAAAEWLERMTGNLEVPGSSPALTTEGGKEGGKEGGGGRGGGLDHVSRKIIFPFLSVHVTAKKKKKKKKHIEGMFQLKVLGNAHKIIEHN